MAEKQMTKDELIELQEKLEDDIERLQKIIDASSETTFEIIIEDLKEQMIDAVNEERWAFVKSCIKEVDAVNGTKNFIEKQSGLLCDKKDQLKDIINKIDNFQPSLFDEPEPEDNVDLIKNTGFSDKNGSELRIGDVYKSNSPNVTNGYWYYCVQNSTEKEGSYALISNFFEGERLLQYPKNLDVLEFAHYEGNIHDNSDGRKKALAGYKVIKESSKTQAEKEPAPDKEEDEKDS